MRQERTVQASLFDLFADHEIGRELKAMWQWLSMAPRFSSKVAPQISPVWRVGDQPWA